MKNVLYVAICCVFISFGQADDPVTKLNVAVVEGAPITAVANNTLIKTNMDRYMALLKNTKEAWDIIVLPEFGLTGRTSDQSVAVNLDNFTADANVTYINGKAKILNAVIVVNLLENDDGDLYSTTLALNGSDKPLAKYRKINLNDTETNLTSSNDAVTFTYKGVTIGLLSGDDILYDEPANKLIKEDNATLLVYTSSMVSIAPFRTAVSLHAGFAKAHGVNMLVASLNDPTNGVSGSGIYQPCAVNSYISATIGSNLITDQIDVKPTVTCSTHKKDGLLFKTKWHSTDNPLSNLLIFRYNEFTTENVTQNIKDKEVCDNSFCCKFNIASSKWSNTEYYRLAVAEDGKVCGLMLCTNKDDINSCGQINTAGSTNFDNITIETSDDENTFVPYILHHNLQPNTDLNQANFLQDDDGANITIAGLSDVIAFGIVAAKSGASSIEILTTSLIAAFFVLKQL